MYSITIEDRYPRALPMDADVEDLTSQGFSTAIRGVPVENSATGASPFVWGRTAEGTSMVVRVEGVRPRLFLSWATVRRRRPSAKNWRRKCPPVSFATTSVASRWWSATCATFVGTNRTPPRRPNESSIGTERPSTPTCPRGVWRSVCDANRRSAPRTQRWWRPGAPRGSRTALESLRRRALDDSTLADSFHEMSRTVSDAKAHLTVLEERFASLTEGWDEFKNEHGDESRLGASVDVHHRAAQEWFVDPTTRFIQESGVQPSKWFRVPPDEVECPVTTCAHEFQANMDSFVPVDREEDAPYARTTTSRPWDWNQSTVRSSRSRWWYVRGTPSCATSYARDVTTPFRT